MNKIKSKCLSVFLLILWIVAMCYKFTPIMELVSSTSMVYTNYIAVLGISVSVITMLTLIMIGSDRFNAYAAVMIVGFGLCFIIALPPFTRPDEEFHYNAAMAVSNIMMGENDTQFTEREYLKTDSFPRYNVTSEAYIEEIRDLKGEDEVDSEKVRTAADRFYEINHPVDYIFSAVGIIIGRVLKLRFTQFFWLGCFFNLLSYAVLTIIAMKLFPPLKEIILLVAAVPMNLHQAASFSYDSLLLGMSYVFTAYVLSLYYEAEKVGWKEVFILSMISLVFFPIKIIYITLLLLFWIIPGKKYNSLSDSLIKKITVTVVSFFVFFSSSIARAFMIADQSAAEMSSLASGIERKMVRLYGFSDLINDPLNIAIMVLRTIYKRAWEWIMTAFGYKMAGLSLYISTYFIYAYILLLIIAVWYYSERMPKQTMIFRAAAVLAALIGSGLVIAAMLFGWTVKSSDTVQGVQGRYFMPLLLPVLACFHSKKHREKLTRFINTERVFTICGLLQVAVIIYIFFRKSL